MESLVYRVSEESFFFHFLGSNDTVPWLLSVLFPVKYQPLNTLFSSLQSIRMLNPSYFLSHRPE
jgi:hypothetical protein